MIQHMVQTAFGVRSLGWMVLLCLFTVQAAIAAEAPARLERLTLEQAVRLAEENHPDLVEALATQRAAEARRNQAGALPDPDVVARMESAPFDRRTADSAEYIAGASQSIPLGRRLSVAKEVRSHERDVAAARVERAARELRHNVHGAFATALYIHATRALFSNNLASAVALTRLAKARLEAGDALPVDVARAEMEELQAATEAKAADSAAQLAITELASAIGIPNHQIASIDGTLDEVFALPMMENVLSNSGRSPNLLAADAEAAALRARVRLAKAESIPDINLELFYRRLQETRQDAFDIGVRLPVPLFSKSRARVREAEAEAESAEARALSKRISAQQSLRRAVADLRRELSSATSLKTEIIPRATAISSNAEVRYKAGDASLTEMIQARRDVSAVQSRYLEQLHAVHEAWRTLALLQPAERMERTP